MSVPNWISYEIFLFTNRRIAASHSPRRRAPKFQKGNEKHPSIRLKVFLVVFSYLRSPHPHSICRTHTHTHTVGNSSTLRANKNTIQLSVMLLQCLVNNGVAINRAADVYCFTRYAGKWVRRNFVLEPAWPICCQIANQNRVYFKYFSLSVFVFRVERNIAPSHKSKMADSKMATISMRTAPMWVLDFLRENGRRCHRNLQALRASWVPNNPITMLERWRSTLSRYWIDDS